MGERFLLTGIALIFQALFFLSSGGCSREQSSDQTVGVVQAITDEEIEQLKIMINEVVESRDKRQFVALFSKPALFASVFEDIDIPALRQRALEAKVNRGGNIGVIADSLFGRLRLGARYDFVRVARDGDSVFLIFRYVFPNRGEIEYHRFKLVRDIQDKIRVGDLYFYFEDRSVSEGMRHGVLKELLLLGELKSESGKDLVSEIPLDPRLSDPFRKCLELTVDKKWDEAWKQFESLPEEVKSIPSVRMNRLQVAARLKPEVYSQAYEETKKLMPENAGLDYQAVQVFRRQGNHEKVIEMVDAIFNRIQDPYINMLKLDPLIRLGKLESARDLIEEFKAKSNSGLLLLVHEFELAVGENNIDLCLSILDRLQDEFGLMHQNLSQLPRYAELIKSPKYKAWKKSKEKEAPQDSKSKK